MDTSELRLLEAEERIRSAMKLSAVLSILLEEGLRIAGCDRGDIWFLSVERNELFLVCPPQGPLAHCVPRRVCAEEGISGLAVKTKVPQVVSDVQARPEYQSLLTRNANTDCGRWLASIVSAIKIPILDSEKVIGVFCAHSGSRIEFSVTTVERLEQLVRRAASAIAAVRASGSDLASVEFGAQKSDVRQDLFAIAATAPKLSSLLDSVLGIALRQIDCTQGIIRLVDERRELLLRAAYHGIPRQIIPLAIPMGAGVVGHVARHAEPMLVDNTINEPAFLRRRREYDKPPYDDFLDNIRSMIAVPFCAEGRVLGVMTAHKNRTNGFDVRDLDALMSVSRYAAGPIEKELSNEKNRSKAAMIDAFEHLLDRAPESGAAVEATLQSVLDYAMKLTGCVDGHILEADRTGEWLQPIASSKGFPMVDIPRQSTRIGVSGKVFRQRRAILLPNPSDNEDFQEFLPLVVADHPFRNLFEILVIPLLASEKCYGVLGLHSLNPDDPLVNPAIICDGMETFGRFTGRLLEQCRLRRSEKEATRRFTAARREVDAVHGFTEIVGDSNAIRTVRDTVSQIASSDATVLLTGESGSGKNLVARSLHNESGRRDGPFISVAMNAVPLETAESELFGHRRGSFTGAHETTVGLFEKANHGTLFLDEIGAIGLNLQIKLLQAIEDGEIRPLGTNARKKIDIRIVAATSARLRQLVADGKFLDALYFRLNVVQLRIPSLRERLEDIPVLCEHFLREMCTKYRKSVTLESDALDVLRGYSWPGNVRELRSVFERLVVTHNTSRLTKEAVQEAVDVGGLGVQFDTTHPDVPRRFPVASASEIATIVVPNEDTLEGHMRVKRKEYVESNLAKTGGDVNKAAESMRVAPSTVWRDIEKLGIDVRAFKAHG